MIRTEIVVSSNTENLHNLGAGSVGPAFYRPYGTLSDFGNFVVGQPGSGDKNERLSLIWEEKSEGFLQIQQVEVAVLSSDGKRCGPIAVGIADLASSPPEIRKVCVTQNREKPRP